MQNLDIIENKIASQSEINSVLYLFKQFFYYLLIFYYNSPISHFRSAIISLLAQSGSFPYTMPGNSSSASCSSVIPFLYTFSASDKIICPISICCSYLVMFIHLPSYFDFPSWLIISLPSFLETLTKH